jgi:hypothetical protein
LSTNVITTKTSGAAALQHQYIAAHDGLAEAYNATTLLIVALEANHIPNPHHLSINLCHHQVLSSNTLFSAYEYYTLNKALLQVLLL